MAILMILLSTSSIVIRGYISLSINVIIPSLLPAVLESLWIRFCSFSSFDRGLCMASYLSNSASEVYFVNMMSEVLVSC